jgi:DNA-binding SARP family transcriptional activator
MLLHRDRPLPRETLACLLWPDCSASQSKSYLRKALWQLQGTLSDGATLHGLLEIEAEWLQLRSSPDLWVDVAWIEQAFALAQGVRGGDLPAETAVRLRDAV